MKRAWMAEKAMYGVGDSAIRVDKALRMKKDSFRCLFFMKLHLSVLPLAQVIFCTELFYFFYRKL